MKFDKEYYTVYNKLLNEKSLNYIDNVTIRVEKLLKTKFNDFSLILFLDIDKILNTISNLTKNAIIGVLSVIKRWLLFKKYDNHRIYTEYSNKINELYKFYNIERLSKYKVPSNNNSIDLDILKTNFINNFENIKKMKYIKMRNHLILAFYLFMPPVRLCNLEHMKYIKNPERLLKNEDTKYNYISKIGGIYNITYNKYKTSKYLKQQSFTIINNFFLIELLDTYFSTFKTELENTESNYLFYNGYDFEKNTDNVSIGASLPKTVYTYTNIKGIHINDIRTAYFKKFYSNNPTIDEERENSYKMGILYSPETKLLYT
jgi:hypothetical protein